MIFFTNVCHFLRDGATPLILAARCDKKDTVRAILGIDSDINILKIEAASGRLSDDLACFVDRKKFGENFGELFIVVNSLYFSYFLLFKSCFYCSMSRKIGNTISMYKIKS